MRESGHHAWEIVASAVAMPPSLQIVTLMLDRPKAARLIQELHGLFQEGLLKEWEEDFAIKQKELPSTIGLSVRRAAKILQILQERRKRTHSDGIPILGIMTSIAENRADLDEDDTEFVDAFWRRRRDYVQLKDFTRIHLIAESLGLSFPRITQVNFNLSKHELAETAHIVREMLKQERAARRRFKRRIARPPMSGNLGCGNDLSPLLKALQTFEEAMGR